MAQQRRKSRTVKKDDLIRQIMPIFLEYGYDGAALSRIAVATGLSKASLYYHFPKGKEDMVRDVLVYAGRQMQALILVPLARRDISVEAAISASFDGVRQYYSGRQPRCLMNSLLLGAGRILVQDQARAALTQWVSQLATVMVRGGLDRVQADDLARQVVEQIQGGLVINSLHTGRDPFDQTIDRLEAQLLSVIKA